MDKIAIYGAGGFGKEVACIINRINAKTPTWDLIGFFDDGVEKSRQISHFGKVLGNYADLNAWATPVNIVFAIGSPKLIKLIVGKITNVLVTYPNIIDPNFDMADPLTVTMGKGNIITKGCTFSCDVAIGDFNILNSLTALAHDVKVGSYNVFMPLTRISGESVVGNGNFFGISAIILQQIVIGDNTRIGAGSVVMTKTKDGFLYMGNPAKKIKF